MDAPDKAIWDYLPEIYRRFLPSFFDHSVRAEHLSDCSHCPMLADHRALSIRPDEVFLPQTKCCTFHPTTPNYLAGEVLGSVKPELTDGRALLSARIARRVGVTPLGISPSKRYLLLYERGKKRAFGRAVSMRCPYYEPSAGACTIWPARSDACSTFFCIHVAGPTGKRFWNTLQRYLQVTQRNVAVWALERLGIETNPILAHLEREPDLSAEDIDETIADETYSRLWGEHEGREIELYVEARKVVSGLTAAEFATIRSTDEVAMKDLEARYLELRQQRLPGVLAVHPSIQVSRPSAERCVLLTAHGDFEVSEFVIELLALFDGRHSNDQIAKHVRERFGAKVDDDYLEVLCKNGVLVDAARVPTTNEIESAGVSIEPVPGDDP